MCTTDGWPWVFIVASCMVRNGWPCALSLSAQGWSGGAVHHDGTCSGEDDRGRGWGEGKLKMGRREEEAQKGGVGVCLCS